MAKPAPDPVTAYARDVLAGKIVAGKPVRLACQRHLNDLKQAKEKGLVWNLDRANHAILFFAEILVLESGAPFVLQPFLAFIVGSCFGWYRTNGYRRFRTAYVEIGKGSAKTVTAAGVGLYGLIADGEPSAEVYSAATTKEQAAICFKDAKRMVEMSPELSELVTVGVGNLAVESTNSLFRPVSSEHRGLDGKRVHMAIVDEIHEHPTAIVVDKIRAGTKQRRNALIFEITNSGFDRNTVCWQHHDLSLKILQGALEDESWFAYVASLDPCRACEAEGKDQPNPACGDCDDWRNEAVWEKANPGLGPILPIEYLREQVREAVNMPSKENIVKRLNFCMWTEQSVRWIGMDQWDACDLAPVYLETLKGRPCYAGLDLASTTDIAALVLVFPPTDTEDYYSVLPFFWVPKDNVVRRRERDKIDYQSWIDRGLIEATAGTVVDYDVIRKRIQEIAEVVEIKEVVKDRWNSTQIGTQLQGDGFTVVDFGQGFASMTAPCKELESLIASQRINHGGNQILRWMASNVAVKLDPAGNLKADKEKSTEKIDGIVAILMGLGRAMVQLTEGPSVYETRGVLVLNGEEQ